MKSPKVYLFGASAVLATLLTAPLPVYANHSLQGFHWARSANPFTLKLADNVSPKWDNHLLNTSNDWSQSAVLDTQIVNGRTKPSACKPTNGQVEVCAAKYGFNGWLGVAELWIYGDHIYQGRVRMNDSYFNTATYNTPAWRNLVMCQEVGHTLGLDHQDEDFYNTPLGTCMDYSADPTLNQRPNQHDYDMLAEIYTHLDSTTTVSQVQQQAASRANSPEPKSFGKLVEKKGKQALYVQELGNGHKLYSFVTLP